MLMFTALGIIFVVVVAHLLYKWLRADASHKNYYTHGNWNYHQIRELLKNEQLPAAIVDMQALRNNALRTAEVAKRHQKKIRIATKSLRVPDLISFVCDVSDVYSGYMCYSIDEAEFLHNIYRYNDLLVAYPTVQPHEIERACWMVQNGAVLYLMVDCLEHVRILEEHISGFCKRTNCKKDFQLKVCIDLDVSWRPFGGLVHIGAHRSPCRTFNDFKQLAQAIVQSPVLLLGGIMAYEAQIAGVPDQNSFRSWMNPIIKLMKRFSYADVRSKREKVNRWIQEKGIILDFFNGGGTGSLHNSVMEPWLTEVTVGSGFLQGTLFDMYEANQNEPAFAIALRVTRIPQPGVVCCQSGGFIASGPISPDKSPSIFLPKGLQEYKEEGFGEVQTPLQVPKGIDIKLGDPVLIRPAKSGEPAERFTEYMCIRNGNVVEKCKTYRGFGKAFY